MGRTADTELEKSPPTSLELGLWSRQGTAKFPGLNEAVGGTEYWNHSLRCGTHWEMRLG